MIDLIFTDMVSASMNKAAAVVAPWVKRTWVRVPRTSWDQEGHPVETAPKAPLNTWAHPSFRNRECTTLKRLIFVVAIKKHVPFCLWACDE